MNGLTNRKYAGFFESDLLLLGRELEDGGVGRRRVDLSVRLPTFRTSSLPIIVRTVRPVPYKLTASDGG